MSNSPQALGTFCPTGRVLVSVFLLYQPACDAVWHQFIQPLSHAAYDSHGDLRPDLLDHLDRNGAGRSKP